MYRNWTNARLLFEADKGGGSGDNKVEDSFQRALDRRNNDGVALAREMFDDNFQMRRKNKELSDKIAELSGKVPADGSLVLTGDDAAAYAAYKALGKPEEVKQGLDARVQLQGQLDSMARDSAIREAAEAAGYKFTVLQDRDKVARSDGKTLTFAVREVETDGQKSKVAYVKDGDSEKPLTDYAREQWGDFMPSLVVQGTTSAASGTAYPAQHAGSGGNKPASTKEQAQSVLNRAYAPRKAAQ